MAMNNEQKAKEFIEQAHKKLNSSSWFSSKTAKFEDAGELYIKAANLFKVSKKWTDAGNAFKEAANCYLNTSSKYEAATCYIKASHCYKKENAKLSAAALQDGVNMYIDEGKFNMAAKYVKELAELCESDGDVENAMKHYETAADYFESENSPSAANGCLLKVAQFAAEMKNYQKAYEIYEQVGAVSAPNALLKWSVKEYLLKAGLCHLAEGDVVGTKKALSRYCSMSPEFMSSREYTLLSGVTDAMENFDLDAFTGAVQEFDSITPLDAWKTNILVDLREKLEKAENDEDLT